MIIKKKEDAIIFLCSKCLNFPETPRRCTNCRQIQCHKCLKKPQVQYQFCQCENTNMLQEPYIYLYKQLSIKCTFCEVPYNLQKIKKHEKKCQHIEYNMLKKFQKIEQFSQIVNQKILTDHDLESLDNELGEEQIIAYNSTCFKCKLCLNKGSIFEMQYHNRVCSKEMSRCDCGWYTNRQQFKPHFISCQINKKIKLEQENQILDQLISSAMFHRETFDHTTDYLLDNLLKATRFDERRETDQDSSDTDH